MKPKLMDRVKQLMTEKEYAEGTRRLYVKWILRYIQFQGVRHPATLGVEEVKTFLGYLAENRKLSGATSNQAISALVFLYGDVLGLPDVSRGIARLRVKRRRGLPTICSKNEIGQVMEHLESKYRLMAYLVYGSGLKPEECVRLRLDDVDLEIMEIRVKGRRTMVAQKALPLLREQCDLAREWIGNIDRYVFPSSKLHGNRCWFVSPSSLQKAMREALQKTAISKQMTPKVLRVSCAMHLLEHGYDARTVQELFGYASVKRVMVLDDMRRAKNVVSPIDSLVG
jgi:site-specific recombinase XerD